MGSFKTPLIITLFVSLGFGVGFGIKLKRDRAAHLGVVTGSRKLRVLTVKGTLPSDFLRAFAATENIQVELAEEATPELVFARLKAPSEFDLVMLMATQVNPALQASKLQPIQTQKIAGFASVSRDFVDLPGHIANVIPIFWGVTEAQDGAKLTVEGLAKASDSGSLWILNFAMAENAKNIEEAKVFLSFILKPESATALSQETHLSSTNSGLETKPVEARLKPSALRQIPLTDLRLVFDPRVERPEATPPIIEKPVLKASEKPAPRPARRLEKPDEANDEEDGAAE